MKMNIKKIMVVFLVVVVLISCFTVSASAASMRTKTYYVYQQQTYGELMLYSGSLGVSTYCELNSAGKIAKSTYIIYHNGSLTPYYVQVGGDYNTDTYDATTNDSPNYIGKTLTLNTGYYFTEAMSGHKVKVNSYVSWCNAECEGDTDGYDIPHIVL